LIAVWLGAMWLLSGAQAAVDATPPADLTPRLGYVERLLTESSAAKQVDASGNPQALELKARALEHYDKALRLADDGDAETAESELREAIRLLTDAAHAAHGDAAVSQKQSEDYGRRRDSVVALATAHDRIAAEKGLQDMNRELQAEVDAGLQASDGLLQQGRPDEARARLDATYEAVKLSLEKLRGGDTLVRELRFESKQDEYAYELDRNDTHRMLVQVLLADKMQAGAVRQTADEFIANAEELRSRAESAAAKAHYEEAIELLEQSTREFIRAIRSAGVYIPG